jgi:2-polyprenyl-3-methyl-5-hydroxy-6-metoxy-1,4-benzoquinol methylase
MPTSLDRLRDDFDLIAAIGCSESGRRRYDHFLLSNIPGNAVDVLDVGCGFGHLSYCMANPHRRVLGIDISTRMIERASRFSETDRVTFLCADFMDVELSLQSYDCIVSAAALHHMPTDAAITKMISLLRQNGRLVLHDLRRNVSAAETVASALALIPDSVARIRQTGRAWMSKAAREAWEKHGKDEQYFSIQEARSVAERFLPGASVHRHPLWRYTIVWDKKAISNQSTSLHPIA